MFTVTSPFVGFFGVLLFECDGSAGVNVILFDSGRSTTASLVTVAVYFSVNTTSPVSRALLIALIVSVSLITASKP